jgi:hypothetical protein
MDEFGTVAIPSFNPFNLPELLGKRRETGNEQTVRVPVFWLCCPVICIMLNCGAISRAARPVNCLNVTGRTKFSGMGHGVAETVFLWPTHPPIHTYNPTPKPALTSSKRQWFTAT